MFILDKVKYHLEGDYPVDVARENVYSLGGMFLGWCIEHDLVSGSLKNDFSEEITMFLNRSSQVNDLYRVSGGVLSEGELSSVGIAFAKDYFDFDRGMYMDDFLDVLADNLPTAYHVVGTWDNYDLLKKVIDGRFDEWNTINNSK